MENENSKLKKTLEEAQNIKRELIKAGKGLDAVAWLLKAQEFWKSGEITESHKVLAYLGEAIELDPENSIAHSNSRLAYFYFS
ncbi:MAG: hypothetical protein BA863_16135 [Desulfovibrio sp. S3730MH75]|nr:MAG: hypothetical protein BA863_16135 [Desulfovibrio sp. S3730MH75]